MKRTVLQSLSKETHWTAEELSKHFSLSMKGVGLSVQEISKTFGLFRKHKLKIQILKGMEGIRKKLVESIIDLSGDELESKESLIDLAMMTDEELVDNLVKIAEYYKNESNN